MASKNGKPKTEPKTELKSEIDRRAPDLERETSTSTAHDELVEIELALRERAGRALRLSARRGRNAAALCAAIGDERKAHEVMVFARDDNAETAFDVAVDYLDGVVDDIATHGGPDEGRYLPLDWEGRPYEGHVVFVRGEVRDYVAEAEAAKLLDEPPPKRGV